MKFKGGFSLLELLLVIAIAAIIFVFSAPFGLNFYRSQLVEEARSNIIDALLNARHNAILQKNDSDFGVTLSEASSSYIMFQGSTYAERDESQDEIFPVINEISFSGLTDVIFSKLTGLPSATGTMNITYGGIAKGILVDDNGGVSKSN